MAQQLLKRAHTDAEIMERGEVYVRTSKSEPIGEKATWTFDGRLGDSKRSKEKPITAKERWKKYFESQRWVPQIADHLHQEIRKGRRAEPPAGYPALAEFMGSDKRWLMCRRFSHLQARLLLEKQDEMRELEQQLHDMDMADREDTPKDDSSGKLFTRHRRNPEEARARREFFKRAETTYKEFADLIRVAQQLTALEQPLKYEWRSVNDFISTTKPVVLREANWIDPENKADVITLRGAPQHAFSGRMLEQVINHVKQSDIQKTLQGWLDANARTNAAASISNSIFVLLTVPLLFFVPIYALSQLHRDIGKSIGVLIAFALVFTFLLKVGTPAREHEALSCAAAYLAVLVVFLGGITHH